MKNDLRLIATWLTIPLLLGIGTSAWLLQMTPEQLAGPIFHVAYGAHQLGINLICVAGTVVVMKLERKAPNPRGEPVEPAIVSADIAPPLCLKIRKIGQEAPGGNAIKTAGSGAVTGHFCVGGGCLSHRCAQAGSGSGLLVGYRWHALDGNCLYGVFMGAADRAYINMHHSLHRSMPAA